MLHRSRTLIRKLSKGNFTVPGDCPNLVRFTESFAQVFDIQEKNGASCRGGKRLVSIVEIDPGILNWKFA
jgi:hypothetical protein